MLDEIIEHSNGLPLIFPIHPSTAKILQNLGVTHLRLYMIEPQGYLEFNYLVERAKSVVTDSVGITEETNVIGVACMRPSETIQNAHKPLPKAPTNSLVPTQKPFSKQCNAYFQENG